MTLKLELKLKKEWLDLFTSLLSSRKSISTRPILSSFPTSSWSNKAMSMKSSSSSYLRVTGSNHLFGFDTHQLRSIPSLHFGFSVLLMVLLLCFSFPRVTLKLYLQYRMIRTSRLVIKEWRWPPCNKDRYLFRHPWQERPLPVVECDSLTHCQRCFPF